MGQTPFEFEWENVAQRVFRYGKRVLLRLMAIKTAEKTIVDIMNSFLSDLSTKKKSFANRRLFI